MTLMLVVGVGEDSGKTTLAASIASRLRERGFRVSVSKPVGASEVWLRPWVLRESERIGYIVTGDSLILSRSIGLPEERVEEVNPVAALLTPIDYVRLPPRSSEAEAASIIPFFRTALLRVSECMGSSVRRLHLAGKEALDRAPRLVAEALREVAGSVKPKPLTVNADFIPRVVVEAGVKAADTCISRMESESDVIVVESNSDIAAPTPLSFARASIVVVAAPGSASIYSGERWRMAVSIQASIGSPWRTSVRDILGLARPEKVVEIPLISDPLEGIPAEYVDEIIDSLEDIKALGREHSNNPLIKR